MTLTIGLGMQLCRSYLLVEILSGGISTGGREFGRRNLGFDWFNEIYKKKTFQFCARGLRSRTLTTGLGMLRCRSYFLLEILSDPITTGGSDLENGDYFSNGLMKFIR
jgi:hypothetical protein